MISEKITGYLEKIYGGGLELKKLAGDASDRSFYRIHFRRPLENGASTAVLMVMVEIPAESELPYLNVQRSMMGAALPVPGIYHFSEDPPILVTEDFGDVTLAEAIAGKDDEKIISLYRKAVDLLVRIQEDGTERMGADCMARALAFDVDKLMFEFNFFYENAILKYKKREPEAAHEKTIREGFLRICEALAAEPRVLTHRDYHSRNLMVAPDGRMCMVDFQDARMGPRQYDLASLLMDSYVDLPADIVKKLYEYYHVRMKEYTGAAPVRERFDDLYDYMVIQRSIKAAGSFAYLDVVKEKNRYLKYFPTVLGYARSVLARREELRKFHDVLAGYVEELR